MKAKHPFRTAMALAAIAIHINNSSAEDVLLERGQVLSVTLALSDFDKMPDKFYWKSLIVSSNLGITTVTFSSEQMINETSDGQSFSTGIPAEILEKHQLHKGVSVSYEIDSATNKIIKKYFGR